MQGRSVAEKLGVRARADKVDRVGLNLVNQQEIAADMAFAVIGPSTLQGMVQPLGAKGRVIGDQRDHGLFESDHVKTPRMGQPLPVLQEGLCVVGGPWRHRTLTCRCFFQDQQAVQQQTQSARGAQTSWRATLPLR